MDSGMDRDCVATVRLSEVEEKLGEDTEVEQTSGRNGRNHNRQPEEGDTGQSVRHYQMTLAGQKISREGEMECDIWEVTQEDAVNRTAEQTPGFKG